MSQTTTSKPRTRSQAKASQAKSTKRIVNMPLLIVSGAACAVFAVLGFLWHRYELSKLSDTFLQRAAVLEQEERWGEAAEYLGRYLRVQPDDTETRLRLIAAVEKSAVSRSARRRLASLLYQILGELPERDDLRIRLAQQLLELRDFEGASLQSKRLVDATDETMRAAGMRIMALSLSSQARPGGLVSIADATKALEQSLTNNPGDVEVASLTAGFYRQFADQLDEKATAANADAIMDRLVVADPKNSAARLARYRYRLQYAPDTARVDLEEVLKRDRNNLEALRLEAEGILATGDKSRFPKAEEDALQFIKSRPGAPEGYVLLARLLLAANDPQRAADTLRDGRAKLGNNINLDLVYLLASVLIDLNKIDDAKRFAKEYSDEVGRWLPELPTAGRIQLESLDRLLQARLALAEGDTVSAVRDLNAVVASADKAGNTPELTRAEVLLAAVFAQQGRPDLAADQWVAIAERSPAQHQAAWRAGIALLEMGQPNRAVVQLEKYLELPQAEPEALITLIQAQLQTQAQLPAAERNWGALLASIALAKQRLPNRWEWQLAEVGYLVAQNATDGRQKALTRLREIELQVAQDEAALERLVVSYQQLGDTESAERAYAAFEKLQPSVVRRAKLRSALFASQNRVSDALAILEQADAAATPEDAAELGLVRLKLLAATQRFDEAQELAAKLIKVSPKNVQVIASGLEIALRRGDDATAVTWEEQLKIASSIDSFEWRYYRARRMIGEFAKLDDNGRAELERLIETLRSERRGLLPVLTLGAQYAAAQGNRGDAIDLYQTALKGGDRRAETLEQLVRLLYAEGRFDEAMQYLSQVKADENHTGRFDSLAIVAAVQGNRLAEAHELAKRSVERGSKDPLHYIWLANLALTSGDRQSAEQTYRTALQRFPKDMRVWNAVFSHFVQTKQPDRARQTLKRFTEQVPMTESQKLLVMGQGNESLGDRDAAQDFYQQATAKDPKDTTAGYLLAKSLLATDAAAARKELQRVLEIDPAQSEARRLMATLLAASGDDADWATAVQYLEAGASDTQGNEATYVDERLKAILLARKGKNRQERIKNFASARRILSDRMERHPGDFNDLDRLLLAGIYEQEAMLGDELVSLQTARDMLRPMVDRADVSADSLNSYIHFLLRHVEAPKESQEAESARDLRRVFAEDARLRVNELEKLYARKQSVDQRLSIVTLQLKLLQAEGRQEDGQKLLREAIDQELAGAKTDPERAKILFKAGNLSAQTGAFADAEKWYRRLEKIAPKTYTLVAQSLLQQGKAGDAVELCLERSTTAPSAELAAVLAQILTTAKIQPELNRRAMQVIEVALDADRGNVELLMTVAVLRLAQEKDDEAILMFRRVVKLQPKNILALNNLATLLAERPNDRSEALECIEQAIAIAGRQPALLDTQGTILYHLGRHQEAIATLEEAVAGSASDPRYYFHLAVAYDGAGQKEDAQQALEKAQDYGLDKAMLTKGDRELLASLKHALLTANVGN